MSSSNGKSEALCLMAYLLRLGLADGAMSPEETQLIVQQRERLGLSETEMADLRTRIRTSDMPMPPTDPEVCERLYLEILELAASDRISDAERTMLLEIAPDFGMSREEALELLDEFDAF